LEPPDPVAVLEDGSGAGGASKDLEFCWNPCCGGGGSWGGGTCCFTEPGFTEKGSADSAFLNLFIPYRFNISLGNHSLCCGKRLIMMVIMKQQSKYSQL
jgi:hypothetical protein